VLITPAQPDRTPQFEDVLTYLQSIKAYFQTDDDFNHNFGLTLASTGQWREQGSVASSLCTAAHPLHTRFANIFGAAVPEAAVRPDPRREAEEALMAVRDPKARAEYCFQSWCALIIIGAIIYGYYVLGRSNILPHPDHRLCRVHIMNKKPQLAWELYQVSIVGPVEKVGPVGLEAGPAPAFYSCTLTGMHGPPCIFWADLTG
jgi:hypothetical protein